MTADPGEGMVVTFPTLGDVLDGWIEQHARVPDGFQRGRAFRQSDWQFWCTANHYRVQPDAVWRPEAPILNRAFTFRRSQIVLPQKALALDTPIATPSGWSTMREIAVGDRVFDEVGRSTRVLSKSPVWRSDTYRVVFSDGAELVACGDHEWWVERRTTSGTYVPDRVRTEDLVGNLEDAHGARRFRVPNARPLQLPDRDLVVPPYTLGAWLGDGETDGGRITGIDEPIFERIRADGFEVRATKISKRVQVIGLKTLLREVGLLGLKHVPAEYLRASEAQRWALLQGLMDTDGHCDARQGKCEFTTTTPALRDGVLELLRSLGVRPVCYQGVASLYGRETGPKWRVMFAARSDMPVFGLARKQDRLRPPGCGHEQHGHRRIVAVERIETVPTQCLTVDAASHVFLAGRDMIPTCNTGKGPWAAAITAAEAVGPVVFGGWAEAGDGYACRENGCGCGWEYEYLPGEPMGIRHPSPLIQLTANSEDQVANVWRPLTAMIRLGPLADLLLIREDFIRIVGHAGDEEGDRIDAVTSSARSRVGNPISFALQDETGLYLKSNKMHDVAEAQRRGAAGMGGRTIETSNAWNPAEQSTAQRTFESTAEDVFKFFRQPPAGLSYRNKRERHQIHRHVYFGSPWVDLDSIEAEAAELLTVDPAQAERFFGNRIVAGSGAWLPEGAIADRVQVRDRPKGEPICLGFDGSDVDDWTAIRAETVEGQYQFTPTDAFGRFTVWNPAETGGRVPRQDVLAAFDHLFTNFEVVRAYLDPPGWESQVSYLQGRYGAERVIEWPTYRVHPMHAALERFRTDLTDPSSPLRVDDDQRAHLQFANAIVRPRNGQTYIIGKPSQAQKIDIVMSSVLAHEAVADTIAAGYAGATSSEVLVFGWR